MHRTVVKRRRVMAAGPSMIVVDTDARRLEAEIRRHEQQDIPIPTASRDELEAIFGEISADCQ